MAKTRKIIRKTHPHLTILEDISTLISHSQDLQETLDSIDDKAQVIELSFGRAGGKIFANFVQRNIIAAGGEIDVLRIGLPNHFQAKHFLVKALGTRHIGDLQRDVAHAAQSCNPAHGDYYSTVYLK